VGLCAALLPYAHVAPAGVIIPDVDGVLGADGGQIEPAHPGVSAAESLGASLLGVLGTIGFGHTDLGDIGVIAIAPALEAEGAVGFALAVVAGGALTDASPILARTLLGAGGRLLDRSTAGVHVPYVALFTDILPGEPAHARAPALEAIGAAAIGVGFTVGLRHTDLGDIGEAPVAAAAIALSAITVALAFGAQGALADTSIVLTGALWVALFFDSGRPAADIILPDVPVGMTGVAPHQPAEPVLSAGGAVRALHSVVAAAGYTHLPQIGEVLIPRTLKAFPAVSVALAGITQNAAAVAGATDTSGPVGTELAFIGGAVTVIVLTVAGFIGRDTHHVDTATVHAHFGFAATLS